MRLLSRYVLQVLSGVAIALGASAAAQAAQTNVAVAANFTDAATGDRAAFKEKTGHEAILSFGSTGQLYTQITQAAPFEVFLAADDERPSEGGGGRVRRSGKPVHLRDRQARALEQGPDLVQGEQTLRSGDFTKIAIANPVGAPYGAAAVQAMQALGVYDQLAPKIVQGNNISQTFQFVETGNAELGFVALSQVAGGDEGSRWVVPDDLYDADQAGRRAAREGRGQRGGTGLRRVPQGPRGRGNHREVRLRNRRLQLSVSMFEGHGAVAAHPTIEDLSISRWSPQIGQIKTEGGSHVV